MAKKEKINLQIVGIVAIVAIVALVILALNGRIFSGSDQDLLGQATARKCVSALDRLETCQSKVDTICPTAKTQRQIDKCNSYLVCVNDTNKFIEENCAVKPDLSDYPNMFIKDGNFNAITVVGQKAPAEDVIAVSDIAWSLRGEINGSIGVGSTKLDIEVTNLKQNIISVGNPCDNMITKKISGITDCHFNLNPGESVIKFYYRGDYYYLVVVGYTPSETREAAKVLANWKDYDLDGTEYKIEAEQTCTDSDGGLNYYVQGTTKGKEGIEFIDRCAWSDVTQNFTGILEHYCDSANSVIQVGVKCSGGCNDGMCLGQPLVPICIDTDGNNIYVKGSARSEYGEGQEDCCVLESNGPCVSNGAYIREGLCKLSPLLGEYVAYSKISECPKGCLDGACIQTCTPDCAGKQCGDDGCGGSCGTCQIGFTCQNNDCICHGSYHVLTQDGRCIWSCGEGTTPNTITNECVCKPGYTETTGQDLLGRRVCTSQNIICIDYDNGTNYHTGSYAIGYSKNTGDPNKRIDDQCMIFNPSTGGLTNVYECSGENCIMYEAICNNGSVSLYSPGAEGFPCTKGCVYGECVPHINCYSNSDCLTEVRYCSESSACVKTSSQICTNAGTINSCCMGYNKETSCTPCPNGCQDGACIEETNGTCSLDPGLACLDYKVTPSTVNMIIRNTMGYSIHLEEIQIISGQCQLFFNTTLGNGETYAVEISGCSNGNIGASFTSNVSISYIHMNNSQRYSHWGYIKSIITQ